MFFFTFKNRADKVEIKSKECVCHPCLFREEVSNSIACLSIFLATDCHVGYLEKDPIRGQDSFATFEEILKEAVKHNVSHLRMPYLLLSVNKNIFIYISDLKRCLSMAIYL